MPRSPLNQAILSPKPGQKGVKLTESVHKFYTAGKGPDFLGKAASGLGTERKVTGSSTMRGNSGSDGSAGPRRRRATGEARGVSGGRRWERRVKPGKEA